MIKQSRLTLSDTPQIICEEGESVSVRLNFIGLTKEVYIGDSSVTAEDGFPLKNEDFKYRNWEFIVIPGDKFCAITTSMTPVVLNILVMSLPAGSVALTSSPPSSVQRISSSPSSSPSSPSSQSQSSPSSKPSPSLKSSLSKLKDK